MNEIVLTLEGINPLDLYGEQDSKINVLRRAFPDLSIAARGHQIKISGEVRKDVLEAKASIDQMVKLLQKHKELTLHMVEDLLKGSNLYANRLSEHSSSNTTLVHGPDGKSIKAKTRNQKKMVESVDRNDVVFALGPAGTGKTYTAVALAVRALRSRTVKKIILTRPAVEAGENLGFLPGDLKDKIDPYLRPLYDALDDMIPSDKVSQFMGNRTIEIAPLAFMRGRTLDNAFIILDEAQNATSLQIKMFLTRLGPSAKCIITGDLTQIDLPYHQRSGLYQAIQILDGVEGIGVVYLTSDDVVRHRLVKDVIERYELHDKKMQERRDQRDKEEDERRAKERAEREGIKPAQSDDKNV